jgi:hypothetical protein
MTTPDPRAAEAADAAFEYALCFDSPPLGSFRVSIRQAFLAGVFWARANPGEAAERKLTADKAAEIRRFTDAARPPEGT